MSKQVILTGLRANNDLTIGNYFGAILPMIDMAKTRSEEFQINMFIPDLHSFTTPIDHSQLHDQILHNARLFVAAGLPLDNDSIYLYRQSRIAAHSELTWVLDCFTGFGVLERMTQFKEKTKTINRSVTAGKAKLENTPENFIYNLKLLQDITKDYIKEVSPDITAGLFNYPVLMAADILLYGAKYIPVGDDQTQHLEYTRDIGERMNNKFGELFTIPEPVKKQHEFFGKDQGLRIKDLVDPTKKMSKSDDSGRGVIFLGDTPVEASDKVLKATTDNVGAIHYDRENQPGISNLLDILALLRGQPLADVVAEFEGKSAYGEFKVIVASAVFDFIDTFQKQLANVDDAAVIAKLEQSEQALIPVANATLLRVQQAVGLRQKDA
jgi:tryptophanyl-tRNA synthetase